MRAALVAALLVALAVAASAVAAQGGERRAGLVVQYGDGSVATACVRFPEEQLSGLELLGRSGLPVVLQSGGIGAAVCKIGPDGCNYPAEGCFCKRDGARSIYWAFYTLQDGAWAYSNLGVANTVVRDGDVQGWAWGLGDSGSGAQPPALGIDAVCAAPAAPTAVPAAATAAPPPATTTPQAATITPQAATATSQAANGSSQAPTTSSQAATATSQAANGSSQAANGSSQAATATSRAANGSSQAATATSRAANGSSQAATATSRAATATSRAANASSQAATATSQATNGSSQAATATSQAAGGTAQAPPPPPGAPSTSYLGFVALALVLIVGAALAARGR